MGRDKEYSPSKAPDSSETNLDEPKKDQNEHDQPTPLDDLRKSSSDNFEN